jgi:metal-responsive CopG/Arc/MetJ family transcriptional regulator
MKTKRLKMVRIQLSLPLDWVECVDSLVTAHAYGGNTRQDVIRALLSKSMDTLKKKSTVET